MFKIKGPNNCANTITHNSQIYQSDKNNIFSVSDEAAKDFVKFHNFSYVSEEEKIEKVEKPSKLKKIEDIDEF